MMTTVLQLKAAIEAHKQMQFLVNTKITDMRTSWATSMSKLFTSLGDMVRSHIADSFTLLDILNDVYSAHVDYVFTGLSSTLDHVDSESANAHVILKIKHRSTSHSVISGKRAINAEALRATYDDALYKMREFEEMLNYEALKSSRQWHYFPNPLRVGDCYSTFHALLHDMEYQHYFVDQYTYGADVEWLYHLTDTLRIGTVSMKKCLLSYQQNLIMFESELDSQLAAVSELEFSYDTPQSSMLNFMLAGHWLQSITRQYVAGSLSKRELAEALHRNGSEVFDAAERLYSDIELSLFTKVSNEVDKQETEMVSFYSNVLRRVSNLQRYMYENDTSLEQFMRRFSIWRMPVVNYQTSQVRRFTHKQYVCCHGADAPFSHVTARMVLQDVI